MAWKPRETLWDLPTGCGIVLLSPPRAAGRVTVTVVSTLT